MVSWLYAISGLDGLVSYFGAFGCLEVGWGKATFYREYIIGTCLCLNMWF